MAKKDVGSGDLTIKELLEGALIHIYAVRVSRELSVERQTDIAHAQDLVEKALKKALNV